MFLESLCYFLKYFMQIALVPNAVIYILTLSVFHMSKINLSLPFTTQLLNLQKQPPGMFCKKRCSSKFCNIHRKTPVLESLFNKVEGQACNFIEKRLQHRCFPVNIAKFLKTPILKNICERLLLIFDKDLNSFLISVAFHIETSLLFCSEK